MTMASRDIDSGRPATAIVMNLFYTGLGIARSLGERGVPVIGLSAHRGHYGNFTRYAKTIHCADSQKDPETLRAELIALGQRLGRRSVLFPTRDHDLVFLDRFRHELEPYFSMVLPSQAALDRCLNKWDTYVAATQATVPTPKTWLVEDLEEARTVADAVRYPCVLKPLAAHHWRTGNNWNLVGSRKAIGVTSRDQLLAEYAGAARADRRVLVQELIPGTDECLVVAACYIDRESKFLGGFNTQKVVQSPPTFGTGCIVRTADRPELFERTMRLLQAMGFQGIAEVEYKWDASDREYKLIEVNPRPWDQHRLGNACGVDLVYLAYRDHAGASIPDMPRQFRPRMWIAEDDFLLSLLRLLWRREPGLGALLRHARGKKQYAIWSAGDPLPFLAYLSALLPNLMGTWFRSKRASPAERSGARQKTPVRVVQ